MKEIKITNHKYLAETLELKSKIESRPIKGFNGRYEITADGRVWSNLRVSPCGRTVGGIFMKPRFDKDGYLLISPCDPSFNKGRKTFSIHRLVASHFLPIPKGIDYLTVNHKNGIKTDNRVENLEWVSMKDNIRHSKRMGLSIYTRGEECGASKLKSKDIPVIRKLWKKGLSYSEIGRRFGVTYTPIKYIIIGKTWKHI
jgi:hypothetical protein